MNFDMLHATTKIRNGFAKNNSFCHTYFVTFRGQAWGPRRNWSPDIQDSTYFWVLYPFIIVSVPKKRWKSDRSLVRTEVSVEISTSVSRLYIKYYWILAIFGIMQPAGHFFRFWFVKTVERLKLHCTIAPWRF
jgi:hypothetical protein